jgi:phage I-like protein
MKPTQNISPTSDDQLAALSSATLDANDVPARVLVAPWGQVESTNGSFVVDDESAALVVAAFDEHGTDIPIDYEHQTLGGTYSSPSGQAPAAGWIKKILSEPGVGILAEIEWTDRAMEMLSSKEYRYLSPVALIRKTDRKLSAIHSVALTNKPAIIGMAPIVNSSEHPDEELLPLVALRQELQLSEDADPHDVLLAASQRIIALERQVKDKHVAHRINEAMRSGKLVEAQRAWAEALVAKEEGLFDEWFNTAPIIVAPGRLAQPHNANGLNSRRDAIIAKARAEFRATPMLTGITNEQAFIASALNEAGLNNSKRSEAA